MQALALHVGDQFSYPQQMGWASVLKGVNDKELARVCQLFRTIIRMKETKPLEFAPCSFIQMPSFRLFQAVGVAGKDAVLPRESLYKAIQLVNFEQFDATLK
ncbi:MAG: hypothetical protein KDK65_04040 [Chlamydiia bacterium]|nr:hypothetical protein [Chlamydiia bacterium]